MSFIKEHPLASFFLLALLWAWFWWAQMILGIWPSKLILIPSSLGGVSPILSMWIIDKVSGSNRLNTILQSAKNWRKNISLLLTAALIFPALNILSKIIASLLGTHITFIESGPDSLGYALILIMPLSFFTGLVSSPLFEEPGWRGFALPQLRERFGLSLASLILGSYWWLWHQGMNLAFGIEPTLVGYLTMLGQSFIIDSLYLTSTSILVAMFAHQSLFILFTYLSKGDTFAQIIGLALLWASVFILRIKPIWSKRDEHQ
ncbi:CPBP family intramembrane metalloprotease [Candidatus Bathyarchaeota archaeon]|nr:CPBP family intramembrane metalloprotease [Candidatus Bathyarchaeota archaeon]